MSIATVAASERSSHVPAGRSAEIRWAFGLCAAMVAAHALLWAIALHRHPASLRGLLDHWDGAAYTQIALHGWAGANWAYFPLYPMLVRWLAPLFGAPELAGMALSTACLFGFVWLALRLKPEGEAALLLPQSRAAWFAFLFAPASWAFHANHTEGLFLLLSFAALACAASRRPLAAGLLAALCVLTRNQGFFVAVFCGVLAASVEQGRGRKWRAFLLTGTIAALGAIVLFTFEYLGTGNPLAFVAAQHNWSHATSVTSALQTLWFGNPWQCTDRENLIRYVAFFIVLAASVALSRRSLAVGLYCAFSMLVCLTQGELVNVLRYAVVLFPVWFWIGDRFARAPRWLRWSAAVGLVLLNLHVARAYGLSRWAY